MRGNKEKKRIVIVEDTPSTIDILYKMLKNKGFEIFVSKNGEKALTIVEKLMPHLILLDVLLPGLDGFEICQLLKKKKNTRDIPIIFMTALTDTEHITKGFEVGGVDYITKPFNVEEVFSRINTHIALYEMKIEQKEQNKMLQFESKELLEAINAKRTLSDLESDMIQWSKVIKTIRKTVPTDDGLSIVEIL